MIGLRRKVVFSFRQSPTRLLPSEAMLMTDLRLSGGLCGGDKTEEKGVHPRILSLLIGN